MKKLSALITQNLLSKQSKLVFIDDGSKDRTWEILKGFTQIIALKLSQNKGIKMPF